MLAHIDRIASCSWSHRRFVGCTSRARSSRSTKMCYWVGIWWLWGPSLYSELSCSRNQFEIIQALWHGALSCWK